MAVGNMVISPRHHNLVLTLRVLAQLHILSDSTAGSANLLTCTHSCFPSRVTLHLASLTGSTQSIFFFFLVRVCTLGEKPHNQLHLHLQGCLLSHSCFWPSVLYYLLLSSSPHSWSAHLTKPFLLHGEKGLLYMNFFSFHSLKPMSISWPW